MMFITCLEVLMHTPLRLTSPSLLTSQEMVQLEDRNLVMCTHKCSDLEDNFIMV